ncbi:MAG: histidine kinase [Myxococcota bacterium]
MTQGENVLIAAYESDRRLRLATSILIVTTVGKELLVAPTLPLLGAGLAHLALMLAVPAAASRGRILTRSVLLLALLAGLATIYITDNGTSVLVVPVIPYVARYEGMVAAALTGALMSLVTVLVSIAAGHSLVDLLQYFAPFVGGVAFLLAYAEAMTREREARAALARMTAVREELARERERRRINQSLHDGVGHYLSAAALQLEAARVTREHDPARSDLSLQRARELLGRSLDWIRQAMAVMRDTSSPAPLPESLAELLTVHRQAGIDSELSLSGSNRTLPPAAVLAIYQSVREALSNTRRHAQARHTLVHVEYGGAEVSVRVEDDGVGAATVAPGVGLAGIRTRVEALGGGLRTTSMRGSGFTLELWVPR